jgi:hypothetical protein
MLKTNDIKIMLLREEDKVSFDNFSMIYFDINMCANCLIHDLTTLDEKEQFPFNDTSKQKIMFDKYNNIIDDFVFITILLGNDFIPANPSLNMKFRNKNTQGYDLLIDTYKKLFNENVSENKYIVKWSDNKLIINWNYWGQEIYNTNDNYNYYQENYNNIVNNSIELDCKIDCKMHIFIHITLIEDWLYIFNELIDIIKSSGLYDKVEKIHLGILSDLKFFFENNIFDDAKFDILYVDIKLELYEIHTINHIKNFCANNDDDEIYILYIHTKGVRNAGNKEVTKSWRSMMTYFLIENHNECLNYLEHYDTLGNNIVNLFCDDSKLNAVNENHNIHYSGNFWWSKKSYIDKLNYLELDMSKQSIKTRYKAENWICSKYPDALIGIIFQDDTNTHPYHRYVFDYYKKMKFNVKKLNI